MASLFLLMVQLLIVLRLAVGVNFSMPNCVDHCGDVKIPYPFGIGANCYHDRSYEIFCNASFDSPKPFLRLFNLEVLDINWSGRYSLRERRSESSIGQILLVSLPRPNLCGAKESRSYDLKGSPYSFSSIYNVLMMEGCGGSAVIKKGNGQILAGCASVCASNAAIPSNMSGTTCYGVGCCQASMPYDTSYLTSAWRRDLDFIEIAVVFKPLMISNSCNALVALIDTDCWNYIGPGGQNSDNCTWISV